MAFARRVFSVFCLNILYDRVARDEEHLNASYSQLKELNGRTSDHCIGLAGRESAVVDKKLSYLCHLPSGAQPTALT